MVIDNPYQWHAQDFFSRGWKLYPKIPLYIHKTFYLLYIIMYSNSNDILEGVMTP